MIGLSDTPLEHGDNYLFFREDSTPAEISPNILDTGYVIAFDYLGRNYALKVYRNLNVWKADDPTWEDLYVCIDTVPFNFDCWGYQYLRGIDKDYYRLDCIISVLYEKNKRLRVHSFVESVQWNLELKKSRTLFSHFEGEQPLQSDLLSFGYRTHLITSHGRSLTIYLSWSAGLDTPMIEIGSMTFRPKPDRSLNEGSWSPPVEHTLIHVLWVEFIKIAPNKPIECLSSRGKTHVLDNFTWTKLSLMSPKEARLARIQFVKKHPELHKKPRLLAEAIKEKGLYAESTSVSQIMKSLPSLIAAITPKDN